MRKERTKYEDLPITNDYIFSRVMLDPEVCKATLEAILGFKIAKIGYPEVQKTIQGALAHKAIRLDVFITDGKGHTYDIEMQLANDHLPQRARYYQSMMTSRQLEVGADYRELTDTYVIFICTFDPFGYGDLLYGFENTCAAHPDCLYEDGARTLFLNLTGEMQGHTAELCDLVRYMKSGDKGSALGGMLARKVDEVHRDPVFKDGFMTVEEYVKREAGILAKEMAEEMAEVMAKEKAEAMAKEKAEAMAEAMAEAAVEDAVEDNWSKSVKALMGKLGLEAEAAMDMIDIPSGQRAGVLKAMDETANQG